MYGELHEYSTVILCQDAHYLACTQVQGLYKFAIYSCYKYNIYLLKSSQVKPRDPVTFIDVLFSRAPYTDTYIVTYDTYIVTYDTYIVIYDVAKISECK